MMNRSIAALVIVMLTATAGLAETMRMAVTTSFHNSGLSDVLLPEIEKDLGLEVQLLVVGTGQAIRLGEAGDVDAILVHSKKAEEAFLAGGYGTHRREIMYNDFVLVGPDNDPIGPIGFAVRDFFRVFRVVLVLVAIVLVIPAPVGQQPQMHLGFAVWLPLVVPALLAVFLQVATEELIFRGYLQSQLAARFAHPVVWMVIPSVIFGFLHLNPESYGENASLIALWAVAFGIVAADLTARSGSLGPAIALHFVNNVVAIMIVAMQHHWDGLALLHMPYGPQDTDHVRAALILEGPILLCFWLAARIAIRR